MLLADGRRRNHGIDLVTAVSLPSYWAGVFVKNADAAAIRKTLGCIKTCAAVGTKTHLSFCPANGKWLDEAPPTSRSREASVPVHELEALVTTWLVGAHVSDQVGAYRQCVDDLQALIDRVTP